MEPLEAVEPVADEAESMAYLCIALRRLSGGCGVCGAWDGQCHHRTAGAGDLYVLDDCDGDDTPGMGEDGRGVCAMVEVSVVNLPALVVSRTREDAEVWLHMRSNHLPSIPTFSVCLPFLAVCIRPDLGRRISASKKSTSYSCCLQLPRYQKI